MPYIDIIAARPQASIGEENAACAPALPTGSTGMDRRRTKQSLTFEYRMAQEAIHLRKQAEGMPFGIRRDELLRKAGQIDVAVQVNNWLGSPGLRAPT
jgi:hypothetical protein